MKTIKEISQTHKVLLNAEGQIIGDFHWSFSAQMWALRTEGKEYTAHTTEGCIRLSMANNKFLRFESLEDDSSGKQRVAISIVTGSDMYKETEDLQEIEAIEVDVFPEITSKKFCWANCKKGTIIAFCPVDSIVSMMYRIH